MEKLPTRKKYLEIYWESLLSGNSYGVSEKVPVMVSIELREKKLKLIKVVF